MMTGGTEVVSQTGSGPAATVENPCDCAPERSSAGNMLRTSDPIAVRNDWQANAASVVRKGAPLSLLVQGGAPSINKAEPMIAEQDRVMIRLPSPLVTARDGSQIREPIPLYDYVLIAEEADQLARKVSQQLQQERLTKVIFSRSKSNFAGRTV
jgi:hypothetical protein